MTKPMIASDGCTTHRDRCRFGHMHSWGLGGFIKTDADGRFVDVGTGPYRTDLMWCATCNGVCYVVDDDDFT